VRGDKNWGTDFLEHSRIHNSPSTFGITCSGLEPDTSCPIRFILAVGLASYHIHPCSYVDPWNARSSLFMSRNALQSFKIVV
jgi:hypothetical protein